MTVGANTYGTVAEIQAMIGDIVASRTFSGSTVPSTTQVEAELDRVAAQLNSLLDVYGYTVPVNSTDYAAAYEALAAANNYGAAGRLLGTVPAQVYDPDEQIEESGTTRAQMYERYFNSMKSQIRKKELRAGMRQGRLSRVKSGGQEDADGNTKKPIFTRGMLDYPGTTTLTEEESDD